MSIAANHRRNRQSDARRRGPELSPGSHLPESYFMRARKGAAAGLHRAGIVALVLGGTAALLTVETRGCATVQLSNDLSNRPSLIVTRTAASLGTNWRRLRRRFRVTKDSRKYRRRMREPSIDTLSPPSTQQFV